MEYAPVRGSSGELRPGRGSAPPGDSEGTICLELWLVEGVVGSKAGSGMGRPGATPGRVLFYLGSLCAAGQGAYVRLVLFFWNWEQNSELRRKHCGPDQPGEAAGSISSCPLPVGAEKCLDPSVQGGSVNSPAATSSSQECRPSYPMSLQHLDKP